MTTPTVSKKRKFDEIDGGNNITGTDDEHVLSHAAQRRLRKRLKTSNAGEEETKPKSTENQLVAPQNSKQGSILTIWIGNLSFNTTPDKLKAFFGEIGGEVRRVHMPTKMLHGALSDKTKSRGDNKGFAYVDFATPEAKALAISKSEEILDGRRLLIKDGNDFAGRPEKDGIIKSNPHPLTGLTKTARKVLSQQKNEPCETLFLGNLSFETTESDIAALFGRLHLKLPPKTSDSNGSEGNNDLLQVRMGTFEDSGKCKGFAFADFKDIQSATNALTNPRSHSLNGRALLVEYATPDAVRRGQIARAKDNSGGSKTKSSRRPQKSERIAAKAAARQRQVSPHSLTEPQLQLPSVVYDKDDGKGKGNDGGVLVEPNKELGKGKERRQSVGKPTRSKPGAALAIAQRENVAIVQSTGKKITFSD